MTSAKGRFVSTSGAATSYEAFESEASCTAAAPGEEPIPGRCSSTRCSPAEVCSNSPRSRSRRAHRLRKDPQAPGHEGALRRHRAIEANLPKLAANSEAEMAIVVLAPLIVYGMSVLFPLERPFMIGVLLYGFASGAPYTPKLVAAARGRCTGTPRSPSGRLPGRRLARPWPSSDDRRSTAGLPFLRSGGIPQG